MFISQIAFFLLAKRTADRNGVPPDQSTRDAMPALLLANPLLGFVLAYALAQRDTPALTAAQSTSTKTALTSKKQAGLQGSDVLGRVLAEVSKQGVMVPSLIGYPRQEALRLLELVNVPVKIIEDAEGGGHTVVGQRPPPGTSWTGKEVLELKLGRRDEVPK